MDRKYAQIPFVVAAALGISPAEVSASSTYKFDIQGWMTALNAAGTVVHANSDFTGPPGYTYRTPVTGTLTYDSITATGSLQIMPFSFFGNNLWVSNPMQVEAIGDGKGGPGSLLLGNMTYNWHTDIGVPLSIVWDARGLLNAVSKEVSIGSVVDEGSLAATDDRCFEAENPHFQAEPGCTGRGFRIPLGAIPLATTTQNTTNVGEPALGSSPSGTLPLVDDGIGGSPQPAGLFAGSNFNFDFTELTVTAIPAAVPVPAAVWLFGSGLLGLLQLARRRQVYKS